MNEKAIEKKTESELTPVTSSIGNMLFEPGVFERVTQMSEIMAKSKAMVPQYLRGNQSDCMAIIMQAAQWRMDPFAVASKTYQIKPGAPIAYEAQLVNSIIIINGPFKERPKYEFFGEWDRVQGKLKEMRNENGGKYAIPDWKPEDEEGLGVTVTLQVVGENEPTSMDVLLKQCWPRNSTNWANDPQQQICYSAIRKMARRHFPDVVMGLYTPDELTHVQPDEKDITPNNSVDDLLPTPQPHRSASDLRANIIDKYLVDISDAATQEALSLVGERIKTESKKVQDRVRDEYVERKRALTPKEETIDKDTGEIQDTAEGDAETTSPGVDPATLIKMVETADSLESLDDIMEMTAGMDKRSKAYKEIVNMVGIRTGEMTEGAPPEDRAPSPVRLQELREAANGKDK